MAQQDVFPKNNEGFDAFQDNMVKQATTNKVAWVIDATQLGLLPPLQAKWAAAYGPCKIKGNATAVQRKARDLAKAAYMKQMRLFIKSQIQNNPNMTDDNKLQCGVKPHKTTRTPVAVPNTTPVVTIEQQTGSSTIFNCRQQPGEDGSSKRGKPDGVAKVKMVWAIAATPPASPDFCNNSQYSGKTKSVVQFDTINRGKTFYGFACWVNSKDQQGPWSNLFGGNIS